MPAVAVLISVCCSILLVVAPVCAQVDSAKREIGREVFPLQDKVLRGTLLIQTELAVTPLTIDAALDSLLRDNPDLRKVILRQLITGSPSEMGYPFAGEALNQRLRASTKFTQFEIMGLVTKRKQEYANRPPIHGQLGQLSVTGFIHLIEDPTK